MRVVFLCRESTWSAASVVRGALWEEFCRHKKAVFQKICLESAWALRRKTDYSDAYKIYLAVRVFMLLWRQPYDLLVINKINYHTLGAVLCCFFRRKRYILDVDDWEYRVEREEVLFAKTFFQYFGDWCARCADAVVVASTFLKEYFSFCRKVIYVPSCVFSHEGQSQVKSSGNIVFCWMGMVDRRDTIDSIQAVTRVFTRVCRQYGAFRLVIIAKGIFEDLVRGLETEYSLPQIRFHYAVDNKDIFTHLKNIDVGILFFSEKNAFYQAKSPTRLFQFFAAGKPVIASAVGECPRFVRSGVNGFLIHSEADLQAVMESIGNDPEGLKSLSDGTRVTTQQWNIRTMAEQLVRKI